METTNTTASLHSAPARPTGPAHLPGSPPSTRRPQTWRQRLVVFTLISSDVLLALVVWGGGVLVLHRLFDNLILFLAELSVIALMIGMLADLINVRLRR